MLYYSLIGLLALLILLITNHDVFRNHPEAANVAAIRTVYRRFLFAVIVYYVCDMLWGVYYAYELTGPLYWSTEFYFIAMGVGVYCWTQFVVAYLRKRGTFSAFLLLSGKVLLGAEAALVVSNPFAHLLFDIAPTGAYVPGPFRHLLLVAQIVLLLLTAIYALSAAALLNDAERDRHTTIGLFGLVVGILLMIQFFFPDLPLYSIGYMLGCCLLRTFVIESQREAYRKSMEAALRREQRQLQELSAARRLAYTDVLTGVKSKLAYAEREEALDQAISDGTAGELAVVVFDLNGLKYINDTYGHERGDQFIIDACRMICDAFKHSPVFRVGGDEFVAILQGIDYEHRESLLAAFDQEMDRHQGENLPVIAAGMAEYLPDVDNSYDRIFKRADYRMYERKYALKQAAPHPGAQREAERPYGAATGAVQIPRSV